MSNPFDPAGTQGSVVGTVGAPTGFFDNMEATLHIASQNDAFAADEAEIKQGWDNSVRALEQRNGSRFAQSNPIRLIEDTLDPNQEHYIRRAFLGASDTSPERVAQFDEAQRINDQLKALNDPALPSLEAVIENVKQARLARATDAAQVQEASAWGSGLLGRFAGGLVGSLADPAQLPALFIPGGIGESVAVKIGGEVVSNAAASAFIQSQLINPQNEMLGEQPGSVAEAALIGGALGGMVGGARVGLGALATRALDRVSFDVGPLDFRDPQLGAMFSHTSDNPTIRAGALALDDQAHFRASNSYPDTTVGYERFNGEAEAITNSLTGTQRVLAQVLPRPEDFTFDNLDYHTQVVREQTPEVYDRLEAATARVNDLDAQILDTQNKLDNLSVGDALGQLDPQTGDLVKSYEAELTNPNLSTADRAAIEQRIQGITESVQAVPEGLGPEIAAAELRLSQAETKAEQLAAARDLDKLYKRGGEDGLQRAMDQVAIPLKKNLQALRASRKAAAKEFRLARNDMDRRIKQVQAEERVKELLKPQQGAGSERSPFDVEALRSDRVSAARDGAAAAHQAMLDGNYGEDLVRTLEEPKAAAEGEAPEPTTSVPEGHVDVGGGLVLPKDFLVSDPEVPGRQTTVGEMFAKMMDDEKLVEAMRVCSL